MTDDLKEQLLPCPYCAGEAHIYTTSQDSDTSVTAQCKECGAEMNFWLPWTAGDGQKAQAWQDVMNRWNTRAPDPRITDLEARLAAAEAGGDALAEAARDLDNFMRSEKAYERSGYGPKLRAALAAYRARRKG